MNKLNKDIIKLQEYLGDALLVKEFETDADMTKLGINFSNYVPRKDLRRYMYLAYDPERQVMVYTGRDLQPKEVKSLDQSSNITSKEYRIDDSLLKELCNDFYRLSLRKAKHQMEEDAERVENDKIKEYLDYKLYPELKDRTSGFCWEGDLDPRFAECVYAVEANSNERLAIWDKYKQKSDNSSRGLTLGLIGENPVVFEFQFALLDNYPIVFFNDQSRFVDHNMVKEFFQKYCPLLSENNCDAMNFSSCVNYIKNLKSQVN